MIADYIGIPFVDGGCSFDGADCYGLGKLIYKEELGIELPNFRVSAMDTRRIWKSYIEGVAGYWTLVDTPEMFDGLAFAYDPDHPKLVQHFGVYIGNGKMIHSLDKIGAFICNLDDFRYCLKGIYRWNSLESQNKNMSLPQT